MAKGARKYVPKIGNKINVFDIDVEKVKHQLFLEKVVLFAGLAIISIFLIFIYNNVQIEGIKAVWMSAILSVGVAAMTIGIAGTLNVEYKGSGLIAKGGLGLAAFLLVFIVSTVIYWAKPVAH